MALYLSICLSQAEPVFYQNGYKLSNTQNPLQLVFQRYRIDLGEMPMGSPQRRRQIHAEYEKIATIEK